MPEGAGGGGCVCVKVDYKRKRVQTSAYIFTYFLLQWVNSWVNAYDHDDVFVVFVVQYFHRKFVENKMFFSTMYIKMSELTHSIKGGSNAFCP